MGNFTTSGSVCEKAGANRSTAITEAQFNRYISASESSICGAVRYDWIANSGAISANFLPIFENVASNLAAIKVINFDMDAIGRATAEDRVNVLYDDAMKDIAKLKTMTQGQKNLN